MTGGGDRTLGLLGTRWLTRAVTAGFLATVAATIVLVVAYQLALALGSADPAASTLQRWLYGLTHNVVTQDVRNSLPLAVLLHFFAGIGWAIVYATVVEPRLDGPAWRRGVLFSFVPWVLSLVLFLPVIGGGLLGLGLGAGPLPILGNLVVHLIYGAILGVLYAPESERPVGELSRIGSPEELSALAHARSTMAVGVVIGLVVGSAAGYLFDAVFGAVFGPLLSILIGAIIGSAIGMLIGSFWGLSPQES